MTHFPYSAELGTLPQALAYLKGTNKMPFVTIDAIMHFHVLEVPGLEALRGNFERRDWYKLASQFRSFAQIRSDGLFGQIADDHETSREALCTEAQRIQLLHALGRIATDIGREEPEMGN